MIITFVKSLIFFFATLYDGEFFIIIKRIKHSSLNQKRLQGNNIEICQKIINLSNFIQILFMFDYI